MFYPTWYCKLLLLLSASTAAVLCLPAQGRALAAAAVRLRRCAHAHRSFSLDVSLLCVRLSAFLSPFLDVDVSLSFCLSSLVSVLLYVGSLSLIQQLAVLMGKVARADWPRQWPNLFPNLVASLVSGGPSRRRMALCGTNEVSHPYLNPYITCTCSNNSSCGYNFTVFQVSPAITHKRVGRKG